MTVLNLDIMKRDWLQEIGKWKQKYDFNFQFWKDNCSVYIYSGGGDVELFGTGGFETEEEVLIVAFEWVYKVNRVPIKERVITLENLNQPAPLP